MKELYERVLEDCKEYNDKLRKADEAAESSYLWQFVRGVTSVVATFFGREFGQQRTETIAELIILATDLKGKVQSITQLKADEPAFASVKTSIRELESKIINIYCNTEIVGIASRLLSIMQRTRRDLVYGTIKYHKQLNPDAKTLAEQALIDLQDYDEQRTIANSTVFSKYLNPFDRTQNKNREEIIRDVTALANKILANRKVYISARQKLETDKDENSLLNYYTRHKVTKDPGQGSIMEEIFEKTIINIILGNVTVAKLECQVRFKAAYQQIFEEHFEKTILTIYRKAQQEISSNKSSVLDVVADCTKEFADAVDHPAMSISRGILGPILNYFKERREARAQSVANIFDKKIPINSLKEMIAIVASRIISEYADIIMHDDEHTVKCYAVIMAASAIDYLSEMGYRCENDDESKLDCQTQMVEGAKQCFRQGKCSEGEQKEARKSLKKFLFYTENSPGEIIFYLNANQDVSELSEISKLTTVNQSAIRLVPREAHKILAYVILRKAYTLTEELFDTKARNNDSIGMQLGSSIAIDCRLTAATKEVLDVHLLSMLELVIEKQKPNTFLGNEYELFEKTIQHIAKFLFENEVIRFGSNETNREELKINYPKKVRALTATAGHYLPAMFAGSAEKLASNEQWIRKIFEKFSKTLEPAFFVSVVTNTSAQFVVV